ncbi:MAG: efflux RND transporter permease subunit, partial [Planctomycetes bacterium]|nr:efflux RND transporter permease subunit [Planctomycetota bacterium]
MTLGGFAIAVGLLIDQSIVVLENTERHLAMGKTPAQAAHDGAIEVAQPVLIIVIATCVVFFPVVLLTGIGRFLFTPLALSVTLALAASYVMAVMLVPACCARFLKPKHSDAPGGGAFARVQEAYVRLLAVLLRWRWATAGGAVGMLVAAGLLLYPRLGQELFPQVDSGQFTIRARVTSGTRVDETERRLAEVENAIKESLGPDRVRKLITNIGVLNDWPAAYTPNSGPHDAFILVQLKEGSLGDLEARTRLRRALPDRFPGIEFAFEPNSMVRAAVNFGLPAPINIQVQGNDLWTSMGVAEEIKRRVSTVSGAVDVRIQQRLDYPQFKLTMNRRKCAELGLGVDDVVKNVVTAFNSSISFAKSFWIDEGNGNHYWIGAQYPEAAFTDLDALR